MSEHWYTKDGVACHTQPTKKGAKNPFRATNITDAKKLNLLPSVSTIIREAYNPALERYKITKAIEACYASPPMPEETIDAYKGRMAADAGRESHDAMDLGTRIHKSLDDYYAGKPIDADMLDYVMSADEAVAKLGIDSVAREFTVASKLHGYAGTTDMAWTSAHHRGILDFKSIKTIKDEPILVRQGYAAQLAAYHVAYWGDDSLPVGSFAYNVYISTTEIGRVDVVEYTFVDLRKEFEWFMSCHHLWRKRTNYDPR